MLTPKRLPPPPQSCDTFAYIGAPCISSISSNGRTSSSGTLFGKNSDRPSSERHEVVRFAPRSYSEGDQVQCTYISVPQAERTLGCILSRPSWMWGCEMGANEAGVVGGNEAIHTLLSDDLISPDDDTPTKRLLGMDLLRLALERGTSAKHALDTCIYFLEAYGQGGPCCQEDTEWTYENSFLFADSHEGYVLETAGVKHWAWERIGPGEFRNISNGISIRSDWGAVSNGIKDICETRGWWDGTSKFDWKRAVGAGGRAHSNLEACGREAAGLAHLNAMKAQSEKKETSLSPRWWVEQMATVLRDEDSGICFRDVFGGFCSTGSQISWLPSAPLSNTSSGQSGTVASHFFTGASDPLCGTPYKLFSFSNPMPTSTKQLEESACHDHDTKKLWDLWRNKTLERISIDQTLHDKFSNMEEQCFSTLENDTNELNIPFMQMVRREIELLQKNNS